MKKGFLIKRFDEFDLLDTNDNIIASTDLDACDYYGNPDIVKISNKKEELIAGLVDWEDTSYVVDAGDNGIRIKQITIKQ